MKKIFIIFSVIFIFSGCGAKNIIKTTETSSDLKVIELEPKLIEVIRTENTLGEFAGDMYRPEGYSSYIGSALALKMSITEDEDYKYSVIMKSYPNNMRNIDEISVEAGINFEDYCVVNDKFYQELGYEYIYYVLITKEDIYKLAEKNVECLYVGSGKNKGDRPELDWESNEWIDWFCENTGDMCVIEGESIRYNPDIDVSW